ncbi:MAG: hypothetical protein FWF86_05985 [Clostridia bacterium]|nr:hypothetical protein [Clostridia bacterium]
MTNNGKNKKALDDFIGTIGQIQERLEELKAFADGHMGFDADSINWGHAGTASRFLQGLTELTDMAYKRGEHAE